MPPQVHLKQDRSISARGDDKQEAFTGLIDEIAFFNVALSDADVKAIADSGLSIALGFASVSPQAKLTTAWAKLKRGEDN